MSISCVESKASVERYELKWFYACLMNNIMLPDRWTKIIGRLMVEDPFVPKSPGLISASINLPRGSILDPIFVRSSRNGDVDWIPRQARSKHLSCRFEGPHSFPLCWINHVLFFFSFLVSLSRRTVFNFTLWIGTRVRGTLSRAVIPI